MNAFTARGAGLRFAPGGTEIRDQAGIDAAPKQVPHMGALDLIAGAHTTRTQDTPVMVQREAAMRRVDADLWVEVRVTDVVDAQFLGQSLQLAIAVRDAHRADVVALGEKQLNDRAAVLCEALRLRHHFHILRDLDHAGGRQLGRALDLDQAQTAGADIAEALIVAERRDEQAVLPGHLEDGLVAAGRDLAIIDLEGNDRRFGHRRAHASTSWAFTAPDLRPEHTPAGQVLCSMCAMYSSRK